MATENLSIQNFYVDSLKSNISASTTVIPLNNVPTVSEGYLVLSPDDPTKKEIIYYTSVNSGAGTVTCPSAALGRGIGGTTAQSHTAGETVKMNIIAEYWTHIRDVTWGKMYPVGSLYLSTVSTDPGTIFGGTWVAWAEGKALVGKAASGTFGTAGATPGAETVSHVHRHSHNHYMNHQHYFATNASGDYAYYYQNGASQPYTIADNHRHDGTTNYTRDYTDDAANGDGINTQATAPSVVQPSLVIYVWKRTA